MLFEMGFFEVLMVGLIGLFYVVVPLVVVVAVVYFIFQRRKEKKVEDKQDYDKY